MWSLYNCHICQLVLRVTLVAPLVEVSGCTVFEPYQYSLQLVNSQVQFVDKITDECLKQVEVLWDLDVYLYPTSNVT